MRHPRTSLGFAALTLGLAAALLTPPARAQSTVSELATALAGDDLGWRRRAELETQLKAYAGGPVEARQTREAVAALARYRLLQPTSAPDRTIIAEWLAFSSHDPAAAVESGVVTALAQRQLEIKDPYGAYLSFKRIHDETGFVDAEQAFIAARTASTANEPRDALQWAAGWLDRADEDTQLEMQRVRLSAGWTHGRTTVAYEALGILEQRAPDRLRLDADALFAATRLTTSLGEIDRAIGHEITFTNVHPDDPRHATVLASLARHYARQAKRELARRHYDWLIQEHPEAREARLAMIERLQLMERDVHPNDIYNYRETVMALDEPALIAEAISQMWERMIAGGHVLEAWAAVDQLCRADVPHGVVAERLAPEFLDNALQLLAERGALTEFLAVASSANSLGIPVSSERTREVEEIQRGFGVVYDSTGYVPAAMRKARLELRRGECGETARQLGPVALGRTQRNLTAEERVEVAAVWAECAWREGWEGDPLEVIARAGEGELPAALRRRLLVLEAGIRFADQRSASCDLYRRAAELQPSRWVEEQVQRCSDGVDG